MTAILQRLLFLLARHHQPCEGEKDLVRGSEDERRAATELIEMAFEMAQSGNALLHEWPISLANMSGKLTE
ncbi:hypothetical protein B0O99DRAFT_616336 [Bisporella sp. PMI_857]|nr:hypothetical protein B0O99DRAFT_616336 [Bisporella sp. PMI_857]